MRRSNLTIFGSTRLQCMGWRRLIHKWAGLLDAWENTANDLAFYYGERALTGMLAAAAWQLSGGRALEEFSALRTRKGSGIKSKAGRGDLWLFLAKKWFTIETKVLWPGSYGKKTIRAINGELDTARSQLRKLDRAYRDGYPVAICWVVPELSITGRWSTNEAIDRFFSQIIEELADEKTLVASYRPSRERRQVALNKRKLYPGVILVGRYSLRF